jgi:hypothetical protein
MSSLLMTKFSPKRLSDSMNRMATSPKSTAYDEKTFRYLLDSEAKRSERSGLSYHILLLYRTDTQGRIENMDSLVAKTVMAALSRCLRETDYIGWYRDGLIAGGVLTVVERDGETDMFSRLQGTLVESLRMELGDEKAGRVLIRLCRHQELAKLEIGEE